MLMALEDRDLYGRHSVDEFRQLLVVMTKKKFARKLLASDVERRDDADSVVNERGTNI